MINFIPIAFAETKESGILKGLDTIIPGGFSEIFIFGLQTGLAIAFCTIIYSGFLFIIAGDNPSKQKEAKEWIIAAIEGLLLLAGAYVLLNVINPNLATVKDVEIPSLEYKNMVASEGNHPYIADATNMSSIPDADKGFFTNSPFKTSYSITSSVGKRWWWTKDLSHTNECKLHSGIDFSPIGDKNPPLYATANGTVSYSAGTGYGNLVIITDDKGYKYYFAHLKQAYITSGTVKVGDVVGIVGTTGNSTGEHLHYEIRTPGNEVIDINTAFGASYPIGSWASCCQTGTPINCKY